jgi:glycosyltransferase involved in cell wall biosynthesis
MRVAVIAPPWVPVPPIAYGGTERVLDSLCRELVRQGHEVLLCATGDSRCPVDRSWTYDAALGTDAIAPIPEVRHVLDAYDRARAWGADVVHDHTILGPFHGMALQGPPVVTTNHGPFDDELTPLYRRLAAGGVPVLAISHHQASTAVDVPIAAVIHHGVDLDDVPVGSGAGGHALFLGRMSPDKGIHVAIEAARAAGVPLRLAAKMSERQEHDYFEQCVRPLLGRDVEYLGEVGGAAKQALLADARCLLNPIQWPEPFGMVMIEALAVGTPVVATPCGAAPEIVDDGVTGFLRSDVASLATALGHVAGLDRAACRRAVEERFTAARMAADHLDAYRLALRRAGLVAA